MILHYLIFLIIMQAPLQMGIDFSTMGNYGVLGFMFTIVLWHAISQQKKTEIFINKILEKTTQEREIKDKESQTADKMFIEYLKDRESEHLQILKSNTEAFNKFSEFLILRINDYKKFNEK